jgi:hypothetical protein
MGRPTLLTAVRDAVAVPAGLAAATMANCSSPASNPRDAGAGNHATSAAVTLSQRVPAGQDLYRCAYLVASAVDSFVVSVAHTASAGGHHVLLFRTDLAGVPNGETTPFDCFADPSNSMQHMRAAIYGSQARSGSFQFPTGVGLPVHGGEVFLLQIHFINAGSADLAANVALTLMSTTQGVSTAAGAFFFNDPFIDLAVATTSYATMRCLVPNDITLLGALSHTHGRALAFAAFLDPASSPPASTPFYYSADPTSAVPLAADLLVTAGARLRFTCTYQNQMAQEYFQGLNDLASEMCAFSGVYYPALQEQAEACALAPDAFGTGTATCAQTLACVSACATPSTAPLFDFGISTAPSVDPCRQKCLVASCPSASAPLFALEQCIQMNCMAPCAAPTSAECSGCQGAQCAAQTSACAGDPCGL